MDEFGAIGTRRKDFASTPVTPNTSEASAGGVSEVDLDDKKTGAVPSSVEGDLAAMFAETGVSSELHGRAEDFDEEDPLGNMGPAHASMPEISPASNAEQPTESPVSTPGTGEDQPTSEEIEDEYPTAAEEIEEEDDFAGPSAEPVFHRISVDNEVLDQYSGNYSADLQAIDCIADSAKLLEYMVEQERKHGLTMPFHACGVDPVCFYSSLGEDADNPFVTIKHGEEEGDFYECVEVDGCLYLSCISRVTDTEYLQRIIAEATEAIYAHSVYNFTMRGPKPLKSEKPGLMLETLKLNTYELSILQSYLERIPNITHHTEVQDGRTVLVFRKEV